LRRSFMARLASLAVSEMSGGRMTGSSRANMLRVLAPRPPSAPTPMHIRAFFATG
jgi:hypothetical protein